MGYVFAFYIGFVYISSFMWYAVNRLPTEYEILPSFNMGFYGLLLVFYGSLFLAADPLTDLPYVDNVIQLLIVAVSQLGFLLLATGTFLQISTYIDPLMFQDEYTYTVLIQSSLISENELHTIMTIGKVVAAFLATPLSLIIIHLSYMRVQYSSDRYRDS